MHQQPVEMHYFVQEITFQQELSLNVKKIIELEQKLLLGESNLFTYNGHLTLSKPFQELVNLLVETGEVDKNIYSARDLKELNTILQQPQGKKGGLLRKRGSARWHLKDSDALLKNKRAIKSLFRELGFSLPKNIDIPKTIDHCIIFGARVERMEKRIKETLHYLNNGMEAKKIYLLGSHRKLIKRELEYLNSMNKNSENIHTEAEAFEFLWSIYASKELLDKTALINSTRNSDKSPRPTTVTTLEDWLQFYNPEKPQTIFALAEKPYTRMLDSLRFTICSNKGNATKDELIKRIQNTQFYFVSPNTSPLLSTILDEIARNVFTTKKNLDYLENLNTTEKHAMIEQITTSNASKFNILYQDYEEEFSPITGTQKDKDGEYPLDLDWSDPQKGFYWKIDDEVAAFCIIGTIDGIWDIFEFYVTPEYRKKGVGKALAFSIFNTFKGKWQVRQISGADDAKNFWIKVINQYTDGNYQESIENDPFWGTVTCQKFKNSIDKKKKSF